MLLKSERIVLASKVSLNIAYVIKIYDTLPVAVGGEGRACELFYKAVFRALGI